MSRVMDVWFQENRAGRFVQDDSGRLRRRLSRGTKHLASEVYGAILGVIEARSERLLRG